MHHANHFVSADPERCAGVQGSRGRHMQANDRRQGLFSSSPTKPPADKSVIAASLPFCETTVTHPRRHPLCLDEMNAKRAARVS
jgi:hypothetical protein